MVSSDASDTAEYCGNSASAGKQASEAQETRRSVQAGARVITDSDQQKKKRSPSSSSSKSLATSEGCSSSREIGCDSSQDEYYHDQITRSLEHDRASSGSPQSSKSLHMESCCSSAMGRAGSTGVVNIRNTYTRIGQSQEELLHKWEVHSDEGFLQWMQALEFQAIGACRTDERLRPLLRWNVSCCGADGQLLSHLGQYFKAQELAMLIRCLCDPLVSIRVGKVSRHGHLLRPTSTRGYLSLRMLLSSEMRLSFVTDAGITEWIPARSSELETSGVILDYLATDPSGRSFVLKSPGHKLSFFWQSESSKAVGDEMVCKMKDLLKRQPSLAQLTGIHETRLDQFASYLHSGLNAMSESTNGAGKLPVTAAVAISSSKTTSLSQVLVPPALASNLPVYTQLPPHFNTFKTLLPQFVGADILDFATSSAWPPRIPTLTSHGLEIGSPAQGGSVSSSQFLEPIQESQQWCMNYSICSGMASLTSPLSLVTSKNQGFIASNSLGRRLNTMWSTQTSFHQEKTEVSSHSAGLCMGLQPTVPSSQHENLEWRPEKKLRMTHSLLSFPVPSLSETLYPFPSMVGVPALSSFLPPPLTQIPISTSSTFSPYYCPCPLGTTTLQYTYAPPFLPTKVGDADFVPSASPFVTGQHPPVLVPPSTLGICGATFPTFFADPISNPHVPLLNIHLSKQNSLVQSTATADVCVASAVPPLLPEHFAHGCLPQLDACSHGLEEEASLRAGVSPTWEALVSAAFASLPVEPLLSQSSITCVTARNTLEGEQNLKEMDGIVVSCDPGVVSVKIGSGAYEKGTLGSSLENAMHLSLPSQQSRPVSGIIPTVVNRTHVFSFCPDLVTKAPELVHSDITVINNTSGLGGSWSPVTTNSRGVQDSQVISCDPTHTKLCPHESKSLANSTLVYTHRSNDEEKPK